MTDSKFCEHGVNVGLKNPPVFCGQCPPDTIESLRAQLAEVTRERDYVAGYQADLVAIRRVLDQYDAPHDPEDGASLEIVRIRLLAEKCMTAERDRDEARAKVARLAKERNDARELEHAIAEWDRAMGCDE